MRRILRELALSGMLAVLAFVGVDSVTARTYVVGPSMEPNLHNGQLLLISRLGISGPTRQVYATARQEEPGADLGWVPPRGAMATFVHPNDPSKVLVKRVIGLPGEEIAIHNGVVYIDGRPLDEPYVVFHDKRSVPLQHIPQDAVFMMGDNRPASGDSRSFGPVPRSQLLGVALLRYWPPSDARPLLGFSR